MIYKCHDCGNSEGIGEGAKEHGPPEAAGEGAKPKEHRPSEVATQTNSRHCHATLKDH